MTKEDPATTICINGQLRWENVYFKRLEHSCSESYLCQFQNGSEHCTVKALKCTTLVLLSLVKIMSKWPTLMVLAKYLDTLPALLESTVTPNQQCCHHIIYKYRKDWAHSQLLQMHNRTIHLYFMFYPLSTGGVQEDLQKHLLWAQEIESTKHR